MKTDTIFTYSHFINYKYYSVLIFQMMNILLYESYSP